MGRARDLGDPQSLIDLVSDKAKKIAATVRILNLGATASPDEQKEGRQQVFNAVSGHRETLDPAGCPVDQHQQVEGRRDPLPLPH